MAGMRRKRRLFMNNQAGKIGGSIRKILLKKKNFRKKFKWGLLNFNRGIKIFRKIIKKKFGKLNEFFSEKFRKIKYFSEEFNELSEKIRKIK